MQADQMRSTRAHRIHIQPVRHLPDAPRLMGCRCAAHQNAKQIPTLGRGKPRVPVAGYLRARRDRDGRRFEMVIQRLGQTKGIPRLIHIAMRHLSNRVHACIGPPGCPDRVGARLQLGQRCLDGALHRRLILLPLPSGKGRTIVFNLKSISGHVLPYRWRERGTIPHLSPLVTQGGSAYP